MKLHTTALLLAAAVTTTAIAQQKPELKDLKSKASYSIGLNIGRNFKQQGLELDTAIVAAGIKDALAGDKFLLTDQEIQETMMSFQKELMASRAAQGEKAKAEGEKFLADNGKKKDVTSLPSGLQYKVLKPGTGKKPTADDVVSTHYRGTLIDGTEFDSSYKRNEPATFDVTGVIKGWTEALQLMPVGSKWQLFIPSTLAYGERGTPDGAIPPHSTLVFDIELLSIEDKGKKP